MVPAWFHLVPTWFHLVPPRGAEEATLDGDCCGIWGASAGHLRPHQHALCKGLPSRIQNLGGNPEGSALFLLGMRNSIAHALPRPALEWRCGDMWGVKLKAGPEPA